VAKRLLSYNIVLASFLLRSCLGLCVVTQSSFSAGGPARAALAHAPSLAIVAEVTSSPSNVEEELLEQADREGSSASCANTGVVAPSTDVANPVKTAADNIVATIRLFLFILIAYSIKLFNSYVSL
jgi:hypothetical protein